MDNNDKIISNKNKNMLTYTNIDSNLAYYTRICIIYIIHLILQLIFKHKQTKINTLRLLDNSLRHLTKHK